jgi:hypothetical protein
VLRQAIIANEASKSPMVLDVDIDGAKVPRTFTINYHGGLQEPHLERVQTTPDVLHDILKPHAGGR